MYERRKFVRLPESLPIFYEVVDAPIAGRTHTKNISQGGMGFFVNEYIAENTLLKIKPTFTEIPFSFEALVRVVWICEDPIKKKYEVGVEFTSIPQKAKEYLMDYIEIIVGTRAV